MSQISLKSISGITSITTPAGVDNQLTVHTNDTTEKLKVTSGGVNVTGVITATSVEVGNNIKIGNAGVITATSFSGSGANLTGIDATAIKDSGGNVKIQAQASGAVYTGIHTFTNETHIVKSGSSSFLVGSTNAGGATIALDGDSNGDGGGADYSFLQHNSDGDLYIVADNPSNASTIKFYTNNSSEKMRLNNEGQLKLSGNNTGNHMMGFGSNVGGLTIDDVGNQHTALEVTHGSNKFYQVCSSNNSNYFSSYGTGDLIFEHTGTAGGNRVRLSLLANGNVSVANTITAGQVAISTTNSTIRNTGVSTAVGTLVFNSTDNQLQVYTHDNVWQKCNEGTVTTTEGGATSDNSNRAGYITHTFNSPGNFVTDGDVFDVEIMAIGGGGGGGGRRYGAGGGAGGVVFKTGVTLNAGTYAIAIGSGGSSNPSNRGSNGNNTTFAAGTPQALTAKGGGGGGCYDNNPPGNPGGSGGGGTSRCQTTPGGSATQPGTNSAPATDYGNRGGNYGPAPCGYAPGGGGGAGGNGTDSVPGAGINGGGNGGIGVQLGISGSNTYYAGGGAGSIYYQVGPAGGNSGPADHYGAGGNGGGGVANSNLPGSYVGGSPSGHGAANTGGGGAGSHAQAPGPNVFSGASGGSGGSGKVIIAYSKSSNPTVQLA